MAFRKILINDIEIEVPESLTLIQACEQAGVEIPRFCYHERLSIAGNCRMCLVEVKGAPKPQASCALAISDLRPGPNGEPAVVFTNSESVQKARKGVMEFLLANHPLDCPICDQGGECDLQDQAMIYGNDKSRFSFPKRAVEEKEFGPVIKTEMTRCIHCTRCVRFSTEIAGVSEMGAINRGEDTEITSYLEQIITNELSGNVIDLCPVGALTSKPAAFTARPWEMKKTETIDVTDAMCSAIVMQARGNEVMRITPRNDDDVNEEWISNKTRYAYDGLKRQRLDTPYVRQNGSLLAVSWQQAFDALLPQLKHGKTGIYAGNHTSLETLFVAKLFGESLEAQFECRPANSDVPAFLSTVKFNPSFAELNHSSAILLIGTNPRKEAAVLNARIRKAWLHNHAEIGLIGEAFDANYDVQHLGNGADALNNFVNTDFAQTLKTSSSPIIIIGEGAVSGTDGANVIAQVQTIIKELGLDDSVYAFLPQTASLVGGVALNFCANNNVEGFYSDCVTGKIETLISLGNDDLQFNRLEKCFKIYIGSHGDKGAEHADIILPTTAYSETDALYLNAEGRVREAVRAVFPVGQAKETWAIFRAISEMMHKTLPFDNFVQVRQKLFSTYPEFQMIDEIVSSDFHFIEKTQKCSQSVYRTTIKDYYMTDAIARASKVLRDCQKAVTEKQAVTQSSCHQNYAA
jgi:NADH-quinone oxidoreductase subunit G